MKQKIHCLSIICFFALCLPQSTMAKGLWLGFTFKKSADIPQIKKNNSKEIGLKILKVMPSSGAMDLGLTTGDWIIGTETGAFTSLKPLKSLLKKSKEGQKVKLKVIQKNKIKWVDFKLYARPDDISKYTGNAVGSKKPYKGKVYENEKALHKKPKLILLDFWATWCGPCRVTSKILEKFHKKYHSKGLEIVGISDEPIKKLKMFFEEHPVSYPLSQDLSGRVSRSYGVKQIPTLFLLDQDGYILKVFFGVPNEKELSEFIERSIY